MAAPTASKQAVATGAAAPAPEAPKVAREVRPIPAAALNWQYEGHCYREAVVRLPAGVILQDIQDNPGLWRTIQASAQKRLMGLDRVTIISFDESWVIKDALVAEADFTRVALVVRPGDVVRMPAKGGTWQDDRHVVKWNGSGWGAYRLSDGIEVIAPTWSTLDAAKAELFRREYQRVA